MKKSIRNILTAIVMVFSMTFASVALPTTAFAIDCNNPANEIERGICAANPNPNGPTDLMTVFTKIINTVLYIVGALAVVMLIVGGIRYTLSAGDAKQVESAKNTIMYAIIGIVVSLLAFAIINFVVDKL